MLKKIGKTVFVQKLVGYVFYLYTCFVYKTGRWTVEGFPADMDEQHRPMLMTFWHGRLMTCTFLYFAHHPKTQYYLLSSWHRDGRLAAAAMKYFHVNTIGGSSNKGGVGAALDMMRVLKDDGTIVIAPDGRKPSYKMTKGVLSLAKNSGAPIVLCTFSVRRGKILKTWDRFLLPFPFSKGVVLFDKPVTVPADADDAVLETMRADLEKKLLDLTIKADEMMGATFDAGLKN